jgi:2-succinyl-5-enolpyruvyl-6-hydroxy-3-cyclohexene-1-carboxylate synthase
MDGMDNGASNLRWADALLEGLLGSGVEHAVLSPGSRSTPLALACSRRAELRSWVLSDERSAAFFALGLSKIGARPTAVLATSGSAPANWMPAVIEASLGQQPLILISADRPVELQGCGANQTIDQIRLFGQHVRAFFQVPTPEASPGARSYLQRLAQRAVDRSRWPQPGPVHINVPLREPLVPSAESLGEAAPTPVVLRVDYPRVEPQRSDVEDLAQALSGRRGLIVCGPSPPCPALAVAISALARRLRCPVLADPLSGLRFGAHERSAILVRYDAFLRRTAFARAHCPDWVLRFGAVPTSKVLGDFLHNVPIAGTTLVSLAEAWPDPSHRVGRVVRSDPVAFCAGLLDTELEGAPEDWQASFVAEEKRAGELCASAADRLLEAALMEAVAAQAPRGCALFLGNSMVIRDADSFLVGGTQALSVFGNRGASGIDGNVSTALGLAAHGATLLGIVGDLALYHDMNGLLAARHLANAVLVVINNGGGAIFDYFPQSTLPDYERFWLTPTDLDPVQIARLYGLRHRRVANARGFSGALDHALRAPGVDLLEVVVDRRASVAQHRAYWAAVAAA